MKTIVAAIDEHGQVTLPVAVRRVLGVGPGDKVAFTIEDNGVRLSPATFTLESAYGSVRPSRKPEDFEKISRVVKEAKAQRTLAKLKQA